MFPYYRCLLDWLADINDSSKKGSEKNIKYFSRFTTYYVVAHSIFLKWHLSMTENNTSFTDDAKESFMITTKFE